MNLKIVKQKLPNVKNREKRLKKNKQSMDQYENTKMYNICTIKAQKGKKKMREKYWEEIKTPNLSNFWKTKVPRRLINHLGTL